MCSGSVALYALYGASLALSVTVPQMEEPQSANFQESSPLQQAKYDCTIAPKYDWTAFSFYWLGGRRFFAYDLKKTKGSTIAEQTHGPSNLASCLQC